jgi:hypothetical protein
VPILKDRFKKRGTKLYALDWKSDGSPSGDLMDSILGDVASFERRMIALRTTRGRLQKAREGRVPNAANYGFDNVDGRYVVNADMKVIHSLFHAIANHESLYSVAKRLNELGVRSPRGGHIYGASLRKYVLNDAYKPHTLDELSAMVSPEILSKLDPQKTYGVVWYNTKSIEYERTPDYRTKQVKKTFKPKEEWIAIPVTDAGIPREIVERARANLHDRSWQISKKNDRCFELSGGVAKCNVCGRNMSTTARKYPKKNGEQGVNYYYTCKNEFCNHKNKFHRVADLEDEAIGVLRDIYGDGSRIKGAVLKHFDDEARKLRDPHQSIEDLTAHVSKLKAKRSKLLDLYLEDSFTKDELNEQAQTLDNQIAEAERQLGKFRDNHKTLREIEGLRREIMEAVVDDQYCYHLGLEQYDYDGTPAGNWKVEGAPTRNHLYKDIGLKVQVRREDAWVEIGGSAFCPQKNFSSKTPTPKSSKPASQSSTAAR